MNPTIQAAVTRALANQPWYVRRKDSLAAAAGLVLQAVNVAAAYATELPEWANVLMAVLIGICQILVHANTPGAITPSQAARLSDAFEDSILDRPSVSGVVIQPGQEVDVVDAITTDTYEGRHRAD